MFEYFERNFGWSFLIAKVLAARGQMAEIDRVCRPLLPLQTTAEGYDGWIEGWSREAGRVRGLADLDIERGDAFGAGRKLLRAAMYFIAAEARARSGDPRRLENYRSALACFEKGVALAGEPVEITRIPYQGTTLPALFTSPAGVDKPPCIVVLNGFDSVKEFNYLNGLPAALARYGIATLLIDHPGTGGALRLQGLKGIAETELPVAAALDHLEMRGAVDPNRLGVIGVSLGGYYAPRAAAFEPRLRCCVAWGAMWDYGKLCRGRLDGSGSGSVYADWLDQYRFVFGDDVGVASSVTDRMTLEPVAHRIKCPTLVIHGDGDRQVPADVARTLAGALVNAPTTLKIFDRSEGGVEHSQADNMTLAIDYMACWVSRALPQRGAA
jgi:dienelactone hydrolase